MCGLLPRLSSLYPALISLTARTDFYTVVVCSHWAVCLEDGGPHETATSYHNGKKIVTPHLTLTVCV